MWSSTTDVGMGDALCTSPHSWPIWDWLLQSVGLRPSLRACTEGDTTRSRLYGIYAIPSSGLVQNSNMIIPSTWSWIAQETSSPLTHIGRHQSSSVWGITCAVLSACVVVLWVYGLITWCAQCVFRAARAVFRPPVVEVVDLRSPSPSAHTGVRMFTPLPVRRRRPFVPVSGGGKPSDARGSGAVPIVLIYHGTFGPAHRGHVATAEAARALAELGGARVTKMVLGFTSNAYAKKKIGESVFVDAAVRCEFARAVFADWGSEGIIFDPEGYTSAEALAYRHATSEDNIVYVVGSDMTQFVKSSNTIVIGRGKGEELAVTVSKFDVATLRGACNQVGDFGLSSTAVRKSLAHGILPSEYGAAARAWFEKSLVKIDVKSTATGSGTKTPVRRLTSQPAAVPVAAKKRQREPSVQIVKVTRVEQPPSVEPAIVESGLQERAPLQRRKLATVQEPPRRRNLSMAQRFRAHSMRRSIGTVCVGRRQQGVVRPALKRRRPVPAPVAMGSGDRPALPRRKQQVQDSRPPLRRVIVARPSAGESGLELHNIGAPEIKEPLAGGYYGYMTVGEILTKHAVLVHWVTSVLAFEDQKQACVLLDGARFLIYEMICVEIFQRLWLCTESVRGDETFKIGCLVHAKVWKSFVPTCVLEAASDVLVTWFVTVLEKLTYLQYCSVTCTDDYSEEILGILGGGLVGVGKVCAHIQQDRFVRKLEILTGCGIRGVFVYRETGTLIIIHDLQATEPVRALQGGMVRDLKLQTDVVFDPHTDGPDCLFAAFAYILLQGSCEPAEQHVVEMRRVVQSTWRAAWDRGGVLRDQVCQWASFATLPPELFIEMCLPGQGQDRRMGNTADLDIMARLFDMSVDLWDHDGTLLYTHTGHRVHTHYIRYHDYHFVVCRKGVDYDRDYIARSISTTLPFEDGLDCSSSTVAGLPEAKSRLSSSPIVKCSSLPCYNLMHIARVMLVDSMEIPCAQQVPVCLPLFVDGRLSGRVVAPQHCDCSVLIEFLSPLLQPHLVVETMPGVWEDNSVVLCSTRTCWPTFSRQGGVRAGIGRVSEACGSLVEETTSILWPTWCSIYVTGPTTTWQVICDDSTIVEMVLPTSLTEWEREVRIAQHLAVAVDWINCQWGDAYVLVSFADNFPVVKNASALLALCNNLPTPRNRRSSVSQTSTLVIGHRATRWYGVSAVLASHTGASARLVGEVRNILGCCSFNAIALVKHRSVELHSDSSNLDGSWMYVIPVLTGPDSFMWTEAPSGSIDAPCGNNEAACGSWHHLGRIFAVPSLNLHQIASQVQGLTIVAYTTGRPVARQAANMLSSVGFPWKLESKRKAFAGCVSIQMRLSLCNEPVSDHALPSSVVDLDGVADTEPIAEMSTFETIVANALGRIENTLIEIREALLPSSSARQGAGGNRRNSRSSENESLLKQAAAGRIGVECEGVLGTAAVDSLLSNDSKCATAVLRANSDSQVLTTVVAALNRQGRVRDADAVQEVCNHRFHGSRRKEEKRGATKVSTTKDTAPVEQGVAGISAAESSGGGAAAASSEVPSSSPQVIPGQQGAQWLLTAVYQIAAGQASVVRALQSMEEKVDKLGEAVDAIAASEADMCATLADVNKLLIASQGSVQSLSGRVRDLELWAMSDVGNSLPAMLPPQGSEMKETVKDEVIAETTERNTGDDQKGGKGVYSPSQSDDSDLEVVQVVLAKPEKMEEETLAQVASQTAPTQLDSPSSQRGGLWSSLRRTVTRSP
eukprot:2165750-Amphidinium_carterae.2